MFHRHKVDRFGRDNVQEGIVLGVISVEPKIENFGIPAKVVERDSFRPCVFLHIGKAWELFEYLDLVP